MSRTESIRNRSGSADRVQPPRLLLDRRFADLESWAQATDWDMSFRQLSPGPLNVRVRVLSGARCIAMHAELNQAFHQIGAPIPCAYQIIRQR